MNRICTLIVGSVWLASSITSFASEEEYVVPHADSELPRDNGIPYDSSAFSSSGNSEWDKWSVQFGVAIITKNVVDDFLVRDFSRAKGDARGEIYLLSVSRDLHEFEWRFRNSTFRPVLGLKGTLGVVDERGRSPFMEYNVGMILRWRDFPWNGWVYTNIESGVGFSYTQKIQAIERQRHPERDRSHLAFYWPVELSLAHPRYKQHQAVLFLHHRSGGRIFHQGGANSVGIAYRYAFGYR